MSYGKVNNLIQELWVKGLEYVSDNHVYKFKDYSESVFDTQIQSKHWLAYNLHRCAPNTKHVSVLAGWYGIVLIPFLWDKFGKINVDIYDVDEYTTDIAKHIWSGCPEVNVYTKDVVFDDIDYRGDTIINTSCEHMMDMRLITQDHANKIFCFQSNDNANVKWLHINCAMDPEQLVEQSGLTNILYQGERTIYEHKRIMVIGKNEKITEHDYK